MMLFSVITGLQYAITLFLFDANSFSKITQWALILGTTKIFLVMVQIKKVWAPKLCRPMVLFITLS